MTTANKLTLARVALIPVFLVILYLDFPYARCAAFGVFVVACLTDFVDGYIARHYNQVTDFGKFMDTLAAKVLDCGCGGGANIKRLLKKCPEGIVKGIDYSPVSVEKSKKVNEAAIAEGRCTVLQGSVADMIFAGDWFDAVTAFVNVYSWPDLPQCFREVYRVLKPGGNFLICNESNGDSDKDERWTEIIGGMTIYKDIQLKAYLEQAGFHDVQIHKKKSWLCVTARK